MHILITGGAGFIGSHLADKLLQDGHDVRVLDALVTQVHGPSAGRPDYLDADVELIVADVRDPQSVRDALKGIDAVYHLAAAVGVGQSMYKIAEYTATNNLGSAVLLEALQEHPVKRLIVASSMSVYGEGLYRRADGTLAHAVDRSEDQLRSGDWEPRDGTGATMTPVPTPEEKVPSLQSVYALSKFDQERLCLLFGRAYGIPTVALRFFNVYGPRQALSNPYTGVLAIFASRLLNQLPPLITEDGQQRRDFVSVHDVSQACSLALRADKANGRTINVGSGEPLTIIEVADGLARVLHKEAIGAEITGKYRRGDIRHCFADIGLATRILGYRPRVTFDQGIEELALWLVNQQAVDHVATAQLELQRRGLLR